MAKTNVRPLGDRVLIQPLAEDTETKSGIIIPETVGKEKSDRGSVVAVGEGRLNEDGSTRIPVSVSVGDTVLFSKYTADEIKVDGTEYLIVREDSILAVVGSKKK